MTFKTLKIFAIGLVTVAAAVLGLALPASAATITGASVTSPALIGNSGTNATPITVTATSVTGSPSDQFSIGLPTGWTFVTTGSAAGSCPGGITVTGFTISACQKINFPKSGFLPIAKGSAITAGTAVTVEFPANSLNVGTTRDFRLEFNNTLTGSGAVVDSAVATLAGGVSNYTVIFNNNGGSGTMSNQIAATAAALTANAFTKEGYAFNGWNTSADGTGTAYADGASYAFTADVTLYAQWKAVLASTGFDGAPYLLVGNLLGVLGVAVLLLSARRRQV